MLWAIDVGNTHTVIGLYDTGWKAVWRLGTHAEVTEDQHAATLGQLCQSTGLPFGADGVVIGSVVPAASQSWRHFAEKWLKVAPRVLETGHQVGLEVTYDPPHAVGADRIANAIAAIEKFGAPVVVVDFGTATTFDTVDASGRYIGGSIMPGVLVSIEALASRAAKLPQVSLEPPRVSFGRNTVDALRHGVMYGYAGAVDRVLEQIQQELGPNVKTVGTGGLARSFMGLCRNLQEIDVNLTLDGLVIAYNRLS